MKWYFWILIIIVVLAIIGYFIWKNKWEKCAKSWETLPNPGGPGVISGDFSLKATCGKKPFGASTEGLMCNWTRYQGNFLAEQGVGIIKNGKCELRN